MFDLISAKVYVCLGILLMYSIGIWNISARHTKAQWDKEKIALLNKSVETIQQRQELANQIGLVLDDKLSKLQITNKTINQKVIHEVTKETVYTNCRTTPNGVQLIEDAIRNKGTSSTK